MAGSMAAWIPSAKPRQRLDQAMVERSICPSREAAKRAIMAGKVRINAQLAHKPSDTVNAQDEISLEGTERFVSRGGLKLEHALHHFQVDVRNQSAVDLGASTGGFTDCLLQHGAAKVYAVDVGHSQLDWKIRSDPRVAVREGLNARYRTPLDLPEAPAICVIDVSFISLTLILPPAFEVLTPTGVILALIKPQFELGKSEVGKGGIVRDPA